ncbi:unnamed protein product [Closterium sp. Naga37s-1]|nr:unnamed protein product [Closterium sp. Naga37s-1]
MLAALKPCLPRHLDRVLCTALHPSAAHRALQPVQYRVLVLWDQAQAAAGTAWIRGFTANSGGDSGNGSNAGGKKGDSAADASNASGKGDSVKGGLEAEVVAEGGGESARVAEASAEGAGEVGEAAASEASAEAVGEEVAADAVAHAGYHGARRGRIRRRDSRIRSATEIKGASSAPAAAAANAEAAARGEGNSVGETAGENAGTSAEAGAEFVMGEGAAGEGTGEGGGLAEETSIVPAGPRPEHYPKVLAIPLTRRPLFPGFYVPVIVKNPKLVAALQQLKAQGTPYVGAFLVRDDHAAAASAAAVAHPSAGAAGTAGAEGADGANGAATSSSSSDRRELGPERSDGVMQVIKPLDGDLAQVMQVIKPLDGDSAQVLLMGHRRLRLTGMVGDDPLTVTVDHIKDLPYDSNSVMIKATVMEVVSTLKDLVRHNPLYKEHIAMFVQHVGEFNASRMADFGAALTTADEPTLQSVLEELDVGKRLSLALMLLKKELELAKLQANIAKGVEEKLAGESRRYMLMEQLKAIKKELGLEKDDKTALIGRFKEKLQPFQQNCPPAAMQVIEEEMAKLQGLEASSSEFNVTRNYLDWLTSIPWGHYSEENLDVVRAQQVLDADHYGLTDVKERILEFIAVGRLKGSTHGKIICLVGPPGVGKTSIGRSIANALDRKFYRFSVGGLSDVAEIKGHRRTYVGAMPGKMVQCLKSTGVANPLVLIDEIDKLGRGHAGDPAGALLEMLDPEQNASFLDHYLDVPLDLSKVLFVCTANMLETIPAPLLDRMEVIRLVGYISDEKTHIARGYLEPAARSGCGVKPEQVLVTDTALHSLIETYCREAGVRNLQKHIERIYRKVALKIVRREGEKEERKKVAAAAAAGLLEDGEEAKEDIISGITRGSSSSDFSSSDSSSSSSSSSRKDSMEIAEKIMEGTEGALDLVTRLSDDGGEGERRGEVKEKDEEENRVLRRGEREEKEGVVDIHGDTDEVKEGKGRENEAEKKAEEEGERIVVDEGTLVEYVGQPVFQSERMYDETPVGVVMGLAWTAMGGSTLYVEATVIEQPVFQSERMYDETPVGVVMGLAWTAMGGSTLYVEATVIEQAAERGSLELTGQLDDVMRESATIAHMVARQNLSRADPGNEFFKKTRMHMHVPAGATPDKPPFHIPGSLPSLPPLPFSSPSSSLPPYSQAAERGSLELTGQLGDVMRESATIAHTVARQILTRADPGNEFFKKTRMHMHVPAGATPKDAVVSALVTAVMTAGGSAVVQVLVKENTIAARHNGVKLLVFPKASCKDYEELSESTYTLSHVFCSHFPPQVKEENYCGSSQRGEAARVPQGQPQGLRGAARTLTRSLSCLLLFPAQVKEKTIAARRNGVKLLVFPMANRKDYEELPEHVREGLDARFVDHYDEIFELAFGRGAEEMGAAEVVADAVAVEPQREKAGAVIAS